MTDTLLETAQHLSDVLGAFSGELLQLHTTEPSRPMRIVDTDAPELTVVIASCAPRNAASSAASEAV